MSKLDQLLEVLLRWAIGEKCKYKAAKWGDWMPADYAGESPPKRKVRLKDQLRLIAAAFGGKYGNDQ